MRNVFGRLQRRLPNAGELGLDGASRVPMKMQRHTLASALGVAAAEPADHIPAQLHGHK